MAPSSWSAVFAATALLALAQGLRGASGPFVAPLGAATGLGLSAPSMFFALGQLAHGLAQPVLGAVADRRAAATLIVAGAVTLAIATAGPAFSVAPAAVAVSLVPGAVASGAVGSNAMLIGEINRRVAASRAGVAIGTVGAGGPLGNLLLGPLTQRWIETAGWPYALWASALLMGATRMATLPPTAALLARHPGAARLGGLLGIVMLVHQVGSFAGILLGGALAQRTRTDTALWCIDIALALGAAALAWGQRERPRVVAPAPPVPGEPGHDLPRPCTPP